MEYTGDKDFDEVLGKCIKILDTKGIDYTIDSGDKLHNFRTVAEFMGSTQEEVLGTYLYKHISAIYAFIKNKGQSESEPIEGRIADVINYMLLFYKMVKEKEDVRCGIEKERRFLSEFREKSTQVLKDVEYGPTHSCCSIDCEQCQQKCQRCIDELYNVE